jgi:hypothetical protein
MPIIEQLVHFRIRKGELFYERMNRRYGCWLLPSF